MTLPALLVVEDEVLIRFDLAEQLRRAGYAVYEANSGIEATKILTSGVNIAVVITDIRMPGMDGLALIQWMKRETPHIKIIVVSGNSPEDLAVDAVFSKPLAFPALLSRLAELFRNGEHHGAPVVKLMCMSEPIIITLRGLFS